MAVDRRSPAAQAWAAAFRPACRQRGMRFVSGEGFILDDVYISAIGALVYQREPDRFKLTWDITIKPLACDDILWAAFMPDVVMGPAMRTNRRINGAAQIQPLLIDRGSKHVSSTAPPDWGPILDHFDRLRTDFIAAHPSAADFVTALEHAPTPIAPNREITRMTTALIAAGRNDDAIRLAESALARGEHGSMSATADVLEYLAAYAKGQHAFAEFLISLIPTHDYQVHYQSRSSYRAGLSRRHHRGMMSRDLHALDGADPWAVILGARTPPGAPWDEAAVRYLQAAGTAQQMVVEIRP